METHAPTLYSEEKNAPAMPNDFPSGSTVIYGLQGKCTVKSIENRMIDGKQVSFYKLEVQKSAFCRSTRQEPAIWVPLNQAKENGLRAPIQATETDGIFKILDNREYYFQVNEPWANIQPKLEATIRNEGCAGLAKVASYLYVLKRKQIIPSPAVARMIETVNKLLLRELSDCLGQPIRNLEARMSKSLRHKLLPDN